MSLTKNDICAIDNTFKINSQFIPKSENYVTIINEVKQPDEQLTETYTPNTTLRKLCAKAIDKLSNIFPEEVFRVLKEHLEKDLKNNDWIIRERTILALGAIGKGSYEYLKPHLSNLIDYLILELQNPNIPIRVISCWAISR